MVFRKYVIEMLVTKLWESVSETTHKTAAARLLWSRKQLQRTKFFLHLSLAVCVAVFLA
jgi:hypothetical protein